MDPICCLLGICCSQAVRRAKVYAALCDLGLSEEHADKVTTWFVELVTPENMWNAIKAQLAKFHV